MCVCVWGGTYQGVTGVMVPAKRVWKIQNLSGTEVEMDTKVFDTRDTMDENGADEVFNSITELHRSIPEFRRPGSSFENVRSLFLFSRMVIIPFCYIIKKYTPK